MAATRPLKFIKEAAETRAQGLEFCPGVQMSKVVPMIVGEDVDSGHKHIAQLSRKDGSEKVVRFLWMG